MRRKNTSNRNSFILALILVAAAVLSACCGEERKGRGTDITSNALSFAEFIAELTPDGWSLADRVAAFSAENLYERIDGRAELYLSYDVVSLTTATFEKEGELGEFIELSVYDMGSAMNGFGIFSVERFSGEPPLELGGISYLSEANVYVWKGRFYVVVVSSEATDEMRKSSLKMAEEAVEALPDSGETIWGLSAFPPEALIEDSIQYYNVDAMGLDFMGKTFTAKYRHEDGELSAFLTLKDTEGEAAEAVKRYAEHAEKYGQGFEEHSLGGVPAVLCDMEGVFDVVFQKGRFVGGVTSVANPDTAITFAERLAASIEESFRKGGAL